MIELHMLEQPVLEMKNIHKSFPGVRALKGVDLELRAGEVLALLGENGAGKSTLIKMLGGAHTPDQGVIRLAGQDVQLRNPVEAQRAGISVIYQEFNLVPALSACENIFLGRERTTAGFVHLRKERQAAQKLFERIGVRVPLDLPCRRLSVAQQQAVEIAKALSLNARIIVMDEPSATLTPQEVQSLFAVIADLKQQGIGIIYISHRLEEISAISDRVMVMRDGENVGTKPTSELNRGQIIEMMVGRKLENEFPARNVSLGAVRLSVENLQRGDRVKQVSLQIHAGEILALTGLVGSGRTETARLLFGADRREAGSIRLDGRALAINSPRDAIQAGISLLTEDRKMQGLIVGQSVLDNLGLPNLPQMNTLGFVHQKHQREAFAGYVAQLRIKVPHLEQRAKYLSGGNQQKVVLAKWLQTNSEVIIFDEPTRGIDVGAKFEIYQLMNELAAQGKAILMISSELPEVLGMADRILVMHEGRITGEIADARKATQEDIMQLAVK